MWLKQCRIAIVFFILMMILTGLIYPGIVTLIAQFGFTNKANGSLIQENGKVVGSILIAQPFTEPQYFWSRPSATSPTPYNTQSSGGSNLGPLNPALKTAIQTYAQALHQADPHNTALIPVDLVTGSGSGLDPAISIAAATYQAPRVASARHLPIARVLTLIQQHTQPRTFGFLGEASVNVLQLNIALDKLSNSAKNK